MYEYATTLPEELYLTRNMSELPPDEAGKEYEDGEAVVSMLRRVTVLAPAYCPVMYRFPDESTVREFPWSFAVPLMYEYATTLPDELYLTMKASEPPDEMGREYAEAEAVASKFRRVTVVVLL